MGPKDSWNWEDIRDGARRTIIGARKNVEDPSIFHKIALIPILAWIGLGADGVSSSSYGPPEAFVALGEHTYLAVFLALGTALTVFIISYAYTRIIEHYPAGGGGYIVATHTISQRAGVLSGSALLIDYMLTITVSIAACADAIFSFLPYSFQPYKLAVACLLIIVLIEMNLRGVKESVMTLAPIFLVFILAHALLLGYGIFAHAPQIGPVAAGFQTGLSTDLAAVGVIGVLAIFLRAYSLGGGTYTGIEAVANGMQIMREPKVKTGKTDDGVYGSFPCHSCRGTLSVLPALECSPGSRTDPECCSGKRCLWQLADGRRPCAHHHTLRGGPALCRRPDRVYRRAAGDGKYGNRFMAPPSFANLSERLTMTNGIPSWGDRHWFS